VSPDPSPWCGTYLGGVHLVDGDNELPDTESESKQSVLSGLTVLGNTGLEFTSTSGNDEDSTISLGGTGDHVLDEVTVSGGVDDLGFPLVKTLHFGDEWAGPTVTMYLGVSNFQRAISMVIPRSRSAFSLSKTQATVNHIHQEGSGPMNSDNNVPYLKEPLPSSAASFSNFSMVRLSIPPHL